MGWKLIIRALLVVTRREELETQNANVWEQIQAATATGSLGI